MLRGVLKILVLESLLVQKQTGYSLMDSIEEQYGKRPSSGSMYPLLNELKEKGFVTFREDGNSKIYSLTIKGKRHIRDILKQHQDMFNTHLKMQKAVSDLLGEECSSINEKELVRNSDVMIPFFRVMFGLMDKKGFRAREEEFRKVIKEAEKKLQELR
ncbi:MAG: PadR family transcriptional regulator [Candidatus Woesearchaeota archaeon]